MTIDEHFILMVFLEALIFFLGIYIMYRGQKKQTDLIEKIVYNPDYASAVAKNMIFGFMQDINEDEEKKEVFFRFIGEIGLNTVEGIRGYYNKSMPEEVKNQALKGVPKPLKGLIKAADVLGIDVGGMLKAKGKEVAQGAIEEVTTGFS